jgi:hypothetical protein
LARRFRDRPYDRSCLGLFDTCPRDATALRMVQA